MSTELYACVFAAEFPAQALVRLRPDLRSEAVVVLEGRAPQETVSAMNRFAERRGAARGMTRLEVETLGGLRALPSSLESEAAARAVFLECAAKFSPRIEEWSAETACCLVLDIAGTERLFGPPEELAKRLRDDLATAGFRVSIAISTNFHTACLKAAATRGITVIPEGAEAVALAKLPVQMLPVPPEHLEVFALWGIRMLGELAALPETELVTRLGQRAVLWRDLAWGTAAHTFEPMEAEISLCELYEFDTPVGEIESLLFVAARMMDSLVARATGRALCIASLTVRMKLEGGREHECSLRPALPSADRKFLLKLLHLEIGGRPPQGAVLSMELTAQAGQSSKVQLGLFTPPTPEPSRLDVTLARLKALVGTDRVGTPVLEDRHRPDSFHVEDFAAVDLAEGARRRSPRMAVRRVRPPHPVYVWKQALQPTAFQDRETRFTITAAYGPWKTSGCWWSLEEWDIEEWDVLAQKNDGQPVACVLTRNCTSNAWQLEAFYD